jgi:O-methyltransferase involved in polyketide biosynthesis
VDAGRVRWIGVDLPETMGVRRRLLPDPPRGRGILHGFLLPLATRLPAARTALLSVWAAGFRTA